MTAQVSNNTETSRPVPDGKERETIADLSAEAARLIRIAGTSVRRVTLRDGERVLEVDWEVGETAPGTAGVEAGAPTEDGTAVRVRAPLVGTFYRAPTPGADPFVEIGDEVDAGQQVGIVEAMKLMNPITADRSGRVVAVPASDGEVVEFEQPLVELEPRK